MTRQTERHAARIADKAATATAREAARKVAKRALLERQTAREKSGFYSSRSVASAIAPSRSRITKRKVKKGQPFCRIIITQNDGHREVSYHATKGWRSHVA